MDHHLYPTLSHINALCSWKLMRLSKCKSHDNIIWSILNFIKFWRLGPRKCMFLILRIFIECSFTKSSRYFNPLPLINFPPHPPPTCLPFSSFWNLGGLTSSQGDKAIACNFRRQLAILRGLCCLPRFVQVRSCTGIHGFKQYTPLTSCLL